MLETAPRRVQAGDRVLIAYTLSTPDEILESTETGFELRLGSGQLHPALERALLDLLPGDEFQLTLDPSFAFGAVDARWRLRLRFGQIPEDLAQLQEGESFTVPDAEGKTRLFRVIHRDESFLEVDGNHPHAGKPLHFSGRFLRFID